MALPKASQQTITQAIDVLHWTLSGDDVAAAEEARRQCRLASPYVAAYLIGVVRGFVPNASPTGRMRAGITLFEGGGIIKSNSEFGLFRRPDEADGAGGQTAD